MVFLSIIHPAPLPQRGYRIQPSGWSPARTYPPASLSAPFCDKAILILSQRILIMPPRRGREVGFWIVCYKYAAATALPVRPKLELRHSLACGEGEGKKETAKWDWFNGCISCAGDHAL
ncbi:MAG: hypothetical protein JWM99_167 [Verrucomicrobiales bacterium]|nr:hypothetical protein [Verrucomicrobiales bacterium]